MKENKLIPAYAIVVYGKESLNEHVYIEKGDFVKSKKGDFVLSGLRPFLTDELRNLQKIGGSNKGIYCDGILDKKVIFFNTDPSNGIIMWVEKACKRMVNFKEEKYRKEYDVPTTLFMVQNENLYVFIIKKKDSNKVSLETMLYDCHYFNVWETGILCVGTGYSANVDYIGINEMIQEQSLNFWTGSYFVHANKSHELLNKIWFEENGNYPEKLWKKKMTIKGLLSKFVRV